MSQVQDSSDCCINSKYSSAQKGYFHDDFLSFYTKRLHPRSPIINRGYYIRFKAMEEVFLSWWMSEKLANCQKFQIISLGAGYDSSYFRLKENHQLPPCCHYVEIDFPDVLKKKYKLIKNILDSTKYIPLEQNTTIVFNTGEYSMLGIDLTDIPVLEKGLMDIGIDYDIPTLFLSECSITYIDPKHSDMFIRWTQLHFPNSVFVAYEQVYPSDAFGLIMRNHFAQVGCSLKSITKYPDEKSQCDRLKNLGWTDCIGVTMHDLFNSLPDSERSRIQLLEMFDEYEMWHEKCHHYFLLWASQGLFSKFIPPFLSVKNPAVDFEQDLSLERRLNWKCLPSNEAVQRFGHQVIPLSSSVILISGGFGMVRKRHQRLGDVSLYDIESLKSFKVCDEYYKHLMGNRMFHSMTRLSNGTIVIVGGRSSPKKVFEEVIVLHHCCLPAVETNQHAMSSSIHSANNIELVSENSSSDTSNIGRITMPLPTWRHSASLVFVKGTECIIVFGGCSQVHLPTNVCFVLNTETWKWSEVEVQEHTPFPRHSHSSVTYKRSCVIITGGLTEKESILQSIHMFDARRSQWSTMPVSGLLPRYSHTSHIWNDYLFLVGGVTNIANFKLGVGVVNLKTLQAFEVHAPIQDPEYPILLSNHSSYIQEDKIFIVGGGGNCFSFGTHFNKKIVSFNVKQLT